jgi:SNF2 family DNA or RNA helicase
MRLKSDLRGYQNRVIKHLYEHDSALAVLKIGAGKTISTLTAIEELIGDAVIRHALIIAPKRVATSVWPREIGDWAHTRHLKFAVLDRTPAHRKLVLEQAHTRQITIVGIDNVQWLCEQLNNVQAENPIFDCLVIDETSKLKDPKSKRAKALAKIAGRFKNRWGLTGTPAPNSLLDLYTPLKIITAGKLWPGGFYRWQKQHFYPIDRNGYQWRVLPGHEAIIQADAATVSIALGEGEMPDLPELSILVDEVTLPDAARSVYNQMESRLFADLDDADILAVSQAVASGKCSQAANGFMYDEAGAAGAHALHAEKELWISELVDDLQGEPLIVIYEFHEDLAMLRRQFGDLPYLGAGVSDAQANQHIDAWNRRELPLLALHPASGGHGLNLQYGGSRMAWIAPTWSAELWDQAIGRIHRPGQNAHVMIHVCVARNTVDELKRLRVIGKLSAQAAFEAYLARSVPSKAA